MVRSEAEDIVILGLVPSFSVGDETVALREAASHRKEETMIIARLSMVDDGVVIVGPDTADYSPWEDVPFDVLVDGEEVVVPGLVDVVTETPLDGEIPESSHLTGDADRDGPKFGRTDVALDVNQSSVRRTTCDEIIRHSKRAAIRLLALPDDGSSFAVLMIAVREELLFRLSSVVDDRIFIKMKPQDRRVIRCLGDGPLRRHRLVDVQNQSFRSAKETAVDRSRVASESDERRRRSSEGDSIQRQRHDDRGFVVVVPRSSNKDCDEAPVVVEGIHSDGHGRRHEFRHAHELDGLEGTEIVGRNLVFVALARVEEDLAMEEDHRQAAIVARSVLVHKLRATQVRQISNLGVGDPLVAAAVDSEKMTTQDAVVLGDWPFDQELALAFEEAIFPENDLKGR